MQVCDGPAGSKPERKLSTLPSPPWFQNYWYGALSTTHTTDPLGQKTGDVDFLHMCLWIQHHTVQAWVLVMVLLLPLQPLLLAMAHPLAMVSPHDDT